MIYLTGGIAVPNSIEVLVVDDDIEIADLVEIYLCSAGYMVYKATNAQNGLNILKIADIKLAVIDVMMPTIDGIEMCKYIRETKNIPIIILSAKSTDLDKIVGLGAGADDYMIKPFNPLELTARVNSQLRRYMELNPNVKDAADGVIRIHDIEIDVARHKVIARSKEVALTPIEFDILRLLANHPDRVFSTDEIFEKVWNEKMYEANNTVMVHIRRLREKIEQDPRKPQIIITVWGVGYKVEGKFV